MSTYSVKKTSEYAGVIPFENVSGVVFRAQTNRCKRVYYLGSYETEREAAAVVDRAKRATVAWSERTRQHYNLRDEGADSQAGGETADSFIAAMLADLRSRFPTHEELKEREVELEQSMPANSLEAMERSLGIAKAMFARAEANTADVKKVFLNQAEEIKELKARLDFQRQEIVELKEELARRDSANQLKGPSGKWEFKKVVPKLTTPGAAPVAPAAPPEPPKDVELDLDRVLAETEMVDAGRPLRDFRPPAPAETPEAESDEPEISIPETAIVKTQDQE